MSFDRLLWSMIDDWFRIWMPHPQRRKRCKTRKFNVTVNRSPVNAVAAKLDRALAKRKQRR